MDVRVAQLQKHERLIWLEERLMKVEVRHLILMLEQSGYDVVDRLQSHLGHTRLIVTGSLKQMGSYDGPSKHDMEEGTSSFDAP